MRHVLIFLVLLSLSHGGLAQSMQTRQYGKGAEVCGDSSVCAPPRFLGRYSNLREMTKREWFAFGSAVGIVKCNNEILGTTTIYDVGGRQKDVVIGASNLPRHTTTRRTLEDCEFHPSRLSDKQPQNQGYPLVPERTEFLYTADNNAKPDRTIYTTQKKVSVNHGSVPFIYLSEAKLQRYIDQGARILVAGYSRRANRLMVSDRCINRLRTVFDRQQDEKSSIYFRNCYLDNGFSGASVLLHFPKGVLGQTDAYYAFCTQSFEEIKGQWHQCTAFEKSFERAVLAVSKS